jgi:hypothetical protein
MRPALVEAVKNSSDVMASNDLEGACSGIPMLPALP